VLGVHVPDLEGEVTGDLAPPRGSARPLEELEAHLAPLEEDGPEPRGVPAHVAVAAGEAENAVVEALDREQVPDLEADVVDPHGSPPGEGAAPAGAGIRSMGFGSKISPTIQASSCCSNRMLSGSRPNSRRTNSPSP